MNKKFSTLCAGLVLATVGASSVSAVELKADGAYNEKLYQIAAGATGDSVVYMTNRIDGNDSLYVKAISDVPANELANTLWCVAVTKPAVQGQSYTFDFLNKATGKKLAVDVKDVLASGWTATTGLPVGTEIDGWAFSMKAGEGEAIEEGMPLYSYIPGENKVAALAFNANGITANPNISSMTGAGHMTAVEMDAESASKPQMITNGWIFTVKVPQRLSLNAKALHTILGSRDSAAINLDFYKVIGSKEQKLDHKKIQNNVFAQDLVAEDGTNGSVYLMKADKSAYLRIDTAYQNKAGEDFLTFTDTTKAATFNIDEAAGRTGIYSFFFTYAPEGDSLFIKMDTAIYSANIGKGPFDVYRSGDDSTHVVLQDLIPGQEWALTVGKDTIRTRIGLGFGTCEASASNKVSVANGLYTIKDKTTGKYFAYPLYQNGANRLWVEFDEESQLAAHMPAYQWIIRKTQTVESLAETSSITIENREYPGNTMTVQLYKDAEGKIFVSNGELANADLEIVEIDKETYPEAYNDPYLGYFHMDPAAIEYNVNKYKFEYYHPYATGENARYLSVGGEKDTLLYAKEYKAGASSFELRASDNEYKYGVVVGTAATDPYKKIGIVQLKRTPYIIAQGEAVMDSITNHKYAMAKGVLGAAIDSFYFKENNHYDGDDFFAILKAVQTNVALDSVKPMYSKAGVSDNNSTSPVGVQNLTTEERTSAFAISLDDTPLYRRFNNANINEVETGVDSLIFWERYRNEYLMDETNENFLHETVDYLGIWSKDKADGKLAFVVDSAWIVRGLGNGIKPQYLISVNRNDFAGKAGEACTEAGPHVDIDGNIITDPYQCVHAHKAIPAFQRGKYLVSFADSVAKLGISSEEARPYLDDDHAYTRVGFVEAIRRGDSLYVLPDAYKSLKNEEINFELLEKENAELVKKNSKYPCPFIINLKGDAHKNVTWSFRYVYPDKALEVTEEGKDNSFLIESMAYPELNGEYNAAGQKLAIAPNVAAWLKNQNGCLVLTNEKSTFANAVTGGDPALRFNIDRKGADDEYATDNEEIATSEVAVIAQEGAVRIANAAGKKVVVTNILGQTVANTVITSSDATIAAPQGVVVVAVEGEEAVKAIVK